MNSQVGTVSVPQVSFEFFPPHSEEALGTLWRVVNRLAPLGPRFVSVTYGAGGSTRARTHRLVTELSQKTALQVAAHLTCIGSSRDEVAQILTQYWDGGIRHLVALRGDLPEGTSLAEAAPAYRYAADLIDHIRQVAPFELSVAGYPEGHPEATSLETDLIHLRDKVARGASQVITQFFFEADTFLRFRDRAERAGVGVPIIPGILPIQNFGQTAKFAAKCGAAIPEKLQAMFEGLDDDPETRQMIASSTAIALCEKLRSEGVDQFHFYTLNRAELTYGICHSLGLRARSQNASQEESHEVI